jgi:Tfp pilus assembly protein PilN
VLARAKTAWKWVSATDTALSWAERVLRILGVSASIGLVSAVIVWVAQNFYSALVIGLVVWLFAMMSLLAKTTKQADSQVPLVAESDTEEETPPVSSTGPEDVGQLRTQLAEAEQRIEELQKLLAANRPPQHFKTPVETINVLTPAEAQEIEELKAENERLRTDATSPEVAKQKRRCFHIADQLRSLYEELLDGERLLIAHFQERQEANVPEKELEEERRAKQLELEGRIRHTYSYGYFDRFEKLYEELEPDGWLGPNDEDLFLNLRDPHDIKKVADRLDDVGRHLL